MQAEFLENRLEQAKKRKEKGLQVKKAFEEAQPTDKEREHMEQSRRNRAERESGSLSLGE